MSTHTTDARPPGRDVFEEVERAIGVLQQHQDPDVRGATATLLEGIDAVHRAGLAHLVTALRAMAGDALINRLVADPAIRVLLMSYDLIAVDRRLQAEEAIDTVRGHLHTHGIDVEILDVVGGVVYVRVHQSPQSVGVSIDAVQADLNAALRECFIGFQELVLRDRTADLPGTVIPLDQLKRARPPVYADAGPIDDLPDGTLRAVVVHDVPVLLGRVETEVYAVRNRCGDSPLPLEFGALEGVEVRCPWHGCRYDVRTGRRLDAAGAIQVLPVKVEAGRIHVAVGVAQET